MPEEQNETDYERNKTDYDGDNMKGGTYLAIETLDFALEGGVSDKGLLSEALIGILHYDDEKELDELVETMDESSCPYSRYY